MDSLFVQSNAFSFNPQEKDEGTEDYFAEQPVECQTTGRIVHLKNGYGFIAPDDGSDNIFFFWQDVQDCDFNELNINDAVTYEPGRNERGPCAKNVARIGADGNR